jgi:hypothetical protein
MPPHLQQHIAPMGLTINIAGTTEASLTTPGGMWQKCALMGAITLLVDGTAARWPFAER